MQVKKFEAPTVQEALDTIKRELGPEAVILQTKRNKRGFGLMSKTSVEVTAAVSTNSLAKKELLDSRLRQDSKEKIQKLSAEKQAEIYGNYMERKLRRDAKRARDSVSLSKAISKSRDKGTVTEEEGMITVTPYIDIRDDVEVKGGIKKQKTRARRPLPVSRLKDAQSQVVAQEIVNREESLAKTKELKEEVDRLKKMISDLQKNQSQSEENVPLSEDQAVQDSLEQLLLAGVDRKYASSLIQSVKSSASPEELRNPEFVLENIAAELVETTEVDPILRGIQSNNKEGAQSIIALVGPTGVGKTTTLAKLASEAMINQKLKVSLINIDRYKVGATDHISTYGKILNVPFRNVSSIEELKFAVRDFQNSDLVLIDTTGRSQRDSESLNHMNEMLRSIPDIRIELVVSSTTRNTELYETGKRFSVFRPESVILSKLDESSVFGSVYNISRKLKLPLSYFTTGQRVPEDIEEATKERVAALILDL